MGNQSNRALLSDYLLGQQSSSFGRNYVLNPSGFENVNNISISGSATVTRNTTTPLTAISDLSVSLPNDTSSGVTWTLNTLDNSLNGQNCMLSFDYTSSSLGSAVQAQVLQGSNISATVTLNPASTPKNVILNTPCGNLGSATTVVIANTSGNSGSSTLNVANVNYGKATNIGTVAQAQLIGTITSICTDGFWGNTNTSLSANSAISGCTFTTTGQALQPSTNIPGIKFASLPPGEYQLIAEGQIGQRNGGAYYTNFQFSDGTNFAREISAVGSGNSSIYISGINQSILYSTPQSNVTLQIYSSASSGGEAQITGGISQPLVIRVYYYPTQSQLVQTPNNSNGNWGATGSLSATTTATSYGQVGTSLSGSITTSGTPQNISCAADATNLGIDCTLPEPGNYQVCYYGYIQNDTVDANTYSKLADSSGQSIVGEQIATVTQAHVAAPVGGCGQYTAASTTESFFVYGKVSAGTGSYTIGSFSVISLATSLTGAISPGSVTSSGSGQYHTEAASLTVTADTGTNWSIVSQTGSWISSVSTGTKGISTLTIAANEFSSAPICTVSSAATGSGQAIIADVSSASTTSVTVYTTDATGNDYSFPLSIICMGPH